MIVELDGANCRLPDFIIIGAAKSGTTSLYFYLRQHPAIFMPRDIKEPGFLCFAGTKRPPHPADNPYPYFWNWVVTDARAYSSLFDEAQDGQLLGEATPEYLYLHEQTIRNIKRYYGPRAKDLKLIVILRDPVERAWSHYSMACRDGYESLPFEKAIDADVIGSRLRNGWHPSYDYRGFGFYADAIRAFQNEFGEDHLKIIRFEDLASTPLDVCRDVFRFLGVSAAVQPNVNMVYNASGRLRHPGLHKWLFRKEHVLKSAARSVIPYEMLQEIKHKIVRWNVEKLELPAGMQTRLANIYRDDVGKLAKIARIDVSSWLSGRDRNMERTRSSGDRGAAQQILFGAFKTLYDVLGRTPLRRVPGMLSLSNLVLRTIWHSHEIELQGFKMHVDMNEPRPAIRRAFQAYILNRVHEPITTVLFKRMVKRGAVVVDAGANVGYFSLLAATLAGPSGKVFSFEPEPRNFDYLKKNIELNKFANVVPVQKAVSDTTGTTNLFICTYDSGHHTINRADGIAAIAYGRNFEERSVSIQTTRLDDALQALGVGKVDVIKVDIEGAEALALKGMQSLFAQEDLTVFIEYFPLLIEKMGSNPDRFIDSLLNDYGFIAYVICSDYDASPGSENLIEVKERRVLDEQLKAQGSHVNLLLSKKRLSGLN